MRDASAPPRWNSFMSPSTANEETRTEFITEIAGSRSTSGPSVFHFVHRRKNEKHPDRINRLMTHPSHESML